MLFLSGCNLFLWYYNAKEVKAILVDVDHLRQSVGSLRVEFYRRKSVRFIVVVNIKGVVNHFLLT